MIKAWIVPPIVIPIPDRLGLGAVHQAPSVPSNSPGRRAASLDAAIDEATVITDDANEPSLARDMIEVHGAEAAIVARAKARAAALAGQTLRAKSWIRVLGLIQRQQAGKAKPARGPATPFRPYKR